MPKLLSLPEDLLIDIASWLDDERDVCSLELTSKGLYNFLSNCSPAGPCKRWLDLRTSFSSPSPEASRSCSACKLSMSYIPLAISAMQLVHCRFAHPNAMQHSSLLCRWLQKRAKWYGKIVSDFSAAVVLENAGINEEPANGPVPPLLPSLLAACAPPTGLTLAVEPDQGELAMTSDLGIDALPA